MHIINSAVSRIESMVEDCGLSENKVTLESEKEIIKCAYERGALLRVTFGGRSAGIATDHPVRATTKPSFMFGASLHKPAQRTAAAGIINALTGFLCTSRKLHACVPENHSPCATELDRLLAGKKIWLCGEIHPVRDRYSSSLVESPGDADLILVTADGMVTDEGGLIPFPDDRVIFIGPSTAGVATMTDGCHFCPYGRTNL
jgi:hypothetical protein